MLKNFFTLLLFLSTVSLPVLSKSLVHRLGVEDGISNNTLYDIVQDDSGFIWLATTESGLRRYDGYRFITFPILHPSEMLSAVQPDVGKLLIDSKNRLWVGTWGMGVSRLSHDRRGLSRFLVDGFQVQSLHETKDGHIWVGTTDGLYRLSNDDSIERIGGPEANQSFVNQRIWSMAEGDNGKLWIGTSYGFYSWHETEGLSGPFLVSQNSTTNRRSNEIRALLYHNQTLWLGGRVGLRAYEPETQKWSTFDGIAELAEKPDFLINTIKPDRNNNLLLGTYEGLYRFSPACRCFIPFRSQNALLPSLNIRAILHDRSGLLWLGTRSHGLFYTRYNRNAFTELAHAVTDNLRKAFTFSVRGLALANDQTLWSAVGQQIYQIDLLSDKAERYTLEASINKIVSDKNETLYIATDAGVYKKPLVDNQYVLFDEPFLKAGLKQPLVRDIIIQSDERYWFGLWGEGVLYYDQQQQRYEHFLPELASNHAGDAIEAMTLMADGSVWVGTRYSGLYHLDVKLGVKAQVQQSHESGLPSDKIQCLDNDGGTLLIICTNKGLVLWDLAANTKRLLGEHDGLASDNVIGVVMENQRIWVLTGHGVSLISPDIPHIVSFNRHDGLSTPELNRNAAAVDSQGMIYLGTLEGIIKLDPSLLWTNTTPPVPKITAIRVNQAAAIPTDELSHESLVLSADENTLEFQFSAMDFHDVQRNSFRYKLVGVDKDWIYGGTRPYAIYSNLHPGEYELQLMAMNNHGLISTSTASFHFKIHPRWWQWRLVQVALGLLVLLLLLAFHFYRMRHIHHVNRLLNQSVEEKNNNARLLENMVNERTLALKEKTAMLSFKTVELEQSLIALAEKNQELTRLDKLKDQFVSTVSHELRTPLTAIRGAIALLSNNAVTPGTAAFKKMIDVALLNGERLSQLINDLLDLQKFESGHFTLQTSRVDLNQLTEQALNGMQPYAERFRVSLRWHNDNKEQWVDADPLRLRQVMDNFLSNAIKFSSADQVVEVSITVKNNIVRWSVIDQGRGISEAFAKRIFTSFTQADASDSRSREGSGLGLAISKKIIESHQGQLGFDSTLGQGSTFWFSLPAEQRA